MEFCCIEDNLPYQVNNYQLTKLIGRGGFSACFLATSTKSALTFCVKVMLQEQFDTNIKNSLFIQKLLPADGFCQFVDYIEDDHFRYLVTEYCPGGSLRSMISKGLFFDEHTLVYYIYHLLLAFSYMHQKGFAHCDIKSTNILLDQDSHIKIIDFSNSVKVEPNSKIVTDIYSPSYAPPEIIEEKPHDPIKSDIWSLGIVFFEMAVGILPWRPFPVELMEDSIKKCSYKIPPTVPPRISDLIHSMLQYNPEDRPSLINLINSPMFKIRPELLYVSKSGKEKDSNIVHKHLLLTGRSCINSRSHVKSYQSGFIY